MNKHILKFLLFLLPVFTTIPVHSAPCDITGNGTGFREVWGYMMRGEEKLFTGNEPVTDIFYFSCSINYRGRLNTAVERPVLPEKNGIKRRIHVVITELSNPALVHFILNPDFNLREKLVDDIVTVSEKFDGVQIDFESVSADDAENFYAFLSLVKMKLKPGKVFSIALPARRKFVRDAYDYKTISSIVDRVFIMTYDEHWSTSEPGPVASYLWCEEVVKYAVKIIPRDKLVMGIPFYGRSWQDKSYSRSIKTRTLEEQLSISDISHEILQKDGNKITYRQSVEVTIYCDDNRSIFEKLMLFGRYTDSVGFWRLGFENSDIWDMISIQN